MLHRWGIFSDFVRPVFSASRVQHVSDLRPKFATAENIGDRKLLKFAGVPQTRQPISAANGPKFTVL